MCAHDLCMQGSLRINQRRFEEVYIDDPVRYMLYTHIKIFIHTGKNMHTHPCTCTYTHILTSLVVQISLSQVSMRGTEHYRTTWLSFKCYQETSGSYMYVLL